MKHSTSVTRKTRLAVAAAAVVSAALGGTAYATSSSSSTTHEAGAARTTSAATVPQAKLRLQTSSPQLASCFPYAASRVVVDLTTDDVGFDTFRIWASGLKKNTAFTVFLIEQPGAPFGHVEYIGDIFTDQYGAARNAFKLIAEEAFAFNNATGDRVDLNSVGFWFADPADDNGCLGAGSPVTGFDGDASAGVQMMNSGVQVLP